ncbi:type II secretion system F family protein [Cellulomonas terrae]|uniref:Type II secretion system protein GspF domain-containing protein n=1 Tax=Cellulomonas terrae TaxID=311234 RepID=A0A511JG80_9CELL|nr:hypothetical protein [Cellulomonas terrae]GEL96829.1 hypothetical protein CTE05_03760 [Cellulomonas terrae]
MRGRGDDGTVQRARAVLAAVRLSEELGAPLAGVLERIASAVAADEEAEGERRAALSGPRSTAQVLAWLPLLGVVLGALLGADPVGVVLSGGPGTVSALVGAALLLLGRWWTAALLARAGRAGDDPAGMPRAGRPRSWLLGPPVVRGGGERARPGTRLLGQPHVRADAARTRSGTGLLGPPDVRADVVRTRS